MTVKTRFAPSPTGSLHLGGARTALFNWLYARNHGGKLVLRIEDTDKARSTQESVEEIIESMKWLGLDYDEGPYYQTERDDIYQAKVDQLLAEGKAYRCTCTKEELDAKREAMQKAGQKPMYDRACRDKNIGETDEPHVIRFKTPLEGVTSFHDTLRGTVEFANKELDDFVLRRTDGGVMYNFVVVIDDAEMEITNVVRGDDHLANTPKQVNIYKAMGYPLPEFTHVSMILGADKKRLSKRHGAQSVRALQEEGFLPSAVLNMLARLGWSDGDNEVFTREQLVERFSLKNITMSGAVFDKEKLTWLNTQHIKMTDDAELARLALPFAQKLYDNADETGILKLMPLVKERSRTLIELAEGCGFYFMNSVEYEEKAKEKFLKDEHKAALKEVADMLEPKDALKVEELDGMFRELAERLDVKMKNIAQPVRVALTGRTVSPGIFEMMEILGKEETLKRIRGAIEA